MTGNIETEIKLLISKSSFKRLYAYLVEKGSKPRVTRQVNYYFDSPDPSRRYGLLNIRIRLANDTAELTCKIPIRELTDKDVISSHEYNARLSLAEAYLYIKNGLSAADIKDHFASIPEFGSYELYDTICYGRLRTTRIAFTIREELPPLLMDINKYLDTVDHEIEWELEQTDYALILLNSLFTDLGIQKAGKAEPKRIRFFRRLEKLRQDASAGR
ncbi:MAG TPA: CYTH domain-containing protein [Candidatus Atribacteria bacterium]|nr:CYTH domain-containing protein [Candidatus Atribacteria bacterium]